MSKTLLIAMSIAFIVVGIIFCLIANFLKSPASQEKSRIAKPSAFLFLCIGAITFATGVLGLSLGQFASKAAVQIVAVIYLALLTVCFAIFSLMVKDESKR